MPMPMNPIMTNDSYRAPWERAKKAHDIATTRQPTVKRVRIPRCLTSVVS
jgi:hypothetical protein